MSNIVMRITREVRLTATFTWLDEEELEFGDLILVELPAESPGADPPLCELFIMDSYYVSNIHYVHDDLLVLPPADWISFAKIAISNSPQAGWTGGPSRVARHVPRERTIPAGSSVTLRPSNTTIRNSLFGGRCPYERCDSGLVLVCETTHTDLSLGESSRWVPLTLCPFCLGNDLLRLHEELVTAVAAVTATETATAELLRDATICAHRQNINAARLQAGYAALPDDPGLFGLGSQTGASEEEIDTEMVVEYMTRVIHAEQTSPTAQQPLIHPLRTPAQLLRTATIRRRGGRPRSRGGNVEFRRLGHDPRPGTHQTHEVNLDEAALTEATRRIQEYHSTFFEPQPRRRTMQVGDAATTTTAMEITHAGAAALQAAVMRAFDDSTPRAPDLPERPRLTDRKVICTAPFSWYKLIQERVLDEVCAICLERFEDGPRLLVSSLPCGHFYHEDCIRGRTREQTTVSCPYRCEGLVQL